MANFDFAYQRMLKNEGGFQLHTVVHDRGGQTYAGIARRYHPDWVGWQWIDQGKLESDELKTSVSGFYKEFFWDVLWADKIENQNSANSLFDYAVNAGVKTAIKAAQKVCRSDVDGIMGPNTLRLLNGLPWDEFKQGFVIAKIERYTDIVNSRPDQNKFLLGWINRTLKDLA